MWARRGRRSSRAAQERRTADARRGLGQIASVFPGLPSLWNLKATQSLPHRFDFMKASYAFYRVGQYTRFAGIEGAPEGNVHFCGEHTSVQFQGYMEGALRSGELAATQIRARL